MDTALFQKQGSIDAYISLNYLSFKLDTPVRTVKVGENAEPAVFNTEFLVGIIKILNVLDTLLNTVDVLKSGDESNGQRYCG